MSQGEREKTGVRQGGFESQFKCDLCKLLSPLMYLFPPQDRILLLIFQRIAVSVSYRALRTVSGMEQTLYKYQKIIILLFLMKYQEQKQELYKLDIACLKTFFFPQILRHKQIFFIIIILCLSSASYALFLTSTAVP